MSPTSSFFTQAENFSMVSGGVDPRTGMYVVNINLGTVLGNNGQGPSLPFILSYSPLTGLSLNNGPGDSPFGAGIGIGLTAYDISSTPFRLTLSSGEQYLVNEFDDKVVLQQKKLDTVHIEKFSDHYTITYKSGNMEILNIPKGAAHILVPTQIINALGHSLTLNWDMLPDIPQLKSIQDENQTTLLTIDYSNSSRPSLQFLPGNQQEGYRVVLQLQNGQLSTVTNYALGDKSPLTWTLSSPVSVGNGSWGQWITGLTTPGGLTETAQYYQDGTGAKFPDSAQLPVLPQVYQLTRHPGGGSPAMTSNFSYTDHDFLGAGSGVDWNSVQDNLYFITGDYSYGSTETRTAGSTTITTKRTYNKYHLLTDVAVSQNGSVYTTHTDYWLDPKLEFGAQPNQFQLPKQVTTTWKSPSGQRQQVLQTVYNTDGNLTQRTDPDGTVTSCNYYPADGSVSGCPSDPTKFVRFVQSVTVTPPATSYTDVSPQIVNYEYSAY
jgi:YD repeat-containing protein